MNNVNQALDGIHVPQALDGIRVLKAKNGLYILLSAYQYFVEDGFLYIFAKASQGVKCLNFLVLWVRESLRF